jgi:hypothetical protein
MVLHVLLVAKRSGPAKRGPRGERIDRSRELLAIAAVGGRVRHDSGGRLLLVELPEGTETKLGQMLTGARLAAPAGDLKAVASGLDATEKLFLEALRLRHSPEFIARKATRRFGESAEEQQLSTGSCVRGY